MRVFKADTYQVFIVERQEPPTLQWIADSLAELRAAADGLGRVVLETPQAVRVLHYGDCRLVEFYEVATGGMMRQMQLGVELSTI